MRQNCVSSAFCLLLGIVLVATPGAAAQPGAADVTLPVPRTFDLTHVESAHYAVALGKDPAKIFEFVRDRIGYEVYTGALRGPRGTLLAMAGNSVDRAALLASLLQQSGQKVRFVRGKLPKAEAKKLVDSMWVERPRPAPAEGEGEPPPALKTVLDTLVAGVTRDYTLIRDHLKKANITPSPQSAPSLDSLVQEAQEHYWVQWWKDNAWVDIDASFAGATPGRRYAPVAETFDALPDALFHRVSIRVRIEEYAILLTGNAAGSPSTREVLSYTAKAADLSGQDIVLAHQPENWKGPATSLQSAISSAIENTGRVKPVLIVGAQPIMGGPFRQNPPTGGGMGGVFSALSGEGTRNPVPIATAETIEFDFIFPGGRKETVVREIFDLVGGARRGTGNPLTADEVRKRTKDTAATDVSERTYGLFFTTGRLDVRLFSKILEEPPVASGQPLEIRAFLRRFNMALATMSDALERLGTPERAIIRFYPDSPRVQIAELSSVAGLRRLAVDLRRQQARAVVLGSSTGDIFFARIFKGVVDGALERMLVEHVTVSAGDTPKWSPEVSTSSVSERASTERVPMLLLTRGGPALGTAISEDIRARIREELASGYLVVAPERPVTVGTEVRFAWWRVDPRSGETTAVTDEGLHGTTYVFVQQGQLNIVRAGLWLTFEAAQAQRYARIIGWALAIAQFLGENISVLQGPFGGGMPH